jgi:extracellular elastinolytic metalloproteinase
VCHRQDSASSPTAARFFAVLALAASLTLAAQATANPVSRSHPKPVAAPVASTLATDPGGPADFDARKSQPPARVSGAMAQARLDLRHHVGGQALLDTDRATGAIRVIGRLDGFLTRPSSKSPQRVVLDYVRQNRGAFGLDLAGVASLELRTGFVDTDGAHHLSFAQLVRGIPVFGAGLKATVTRDGRLVGIVDGPAPNVSLRSMTPTLSAASAVSRALRNAGAPADAAGRVVSRAGGATSATVFATGNRASLMVFPTATGGRLGWLVNAYAGSTAAYLDVVDADSGSVLFRQNTVAFDNDATGQAWQYYPSTLLPAGVGSQATVHFPVNNTGARLAGNNVHTYLDPRDTIVVPGGAVPAGDEVPATTTGTNPVWNYPASLITNDPFNNCSTHFSCTWQSSTADSWAPNAKQNATQVYFYVNNFHDWLKINPNIGFTEAAGNFQASNGAAGGLGGDAVQAQADDGADTATSAGGTTSPGGGFPDGDHVVNANMSTQQDGAPPRMQMYLFPSSFLNSTAPDANGGDDASVIYHEYTHGLSNRLVTDPNGLPGLNGFQSGAMGEAWSDWYAMDYLMAKHFDLDTSTVGDVQVGFFIGGGTTVPLRSEPMDCPRQNNSFGGVCLGGSTSHAGGYSYGDMGHIISGPEVHADGEIWAQTLWQLRAKVGGLVAEKLVTRGMMLAPINPSMLDARNAILQADKAFFAGSHQSGLWSVFANRGMGFFAGTDSANDVTPTQNFSLPPSCPASCTAITGTITDSFTHAPVSGARVGIQGHNSSLANDLADTTDASGHYRIANVPKNHTYILEFGKKGFLPAVKTVSVGTTSVSVNKAIVHDWAAKSGGARILSATRPDYTAFGCGPDNAIDLSQLQGWGSDAPSNPHSGVSGPRTIVIHLSAKTDIKQFRIDPSATCGDGPSAAVKNFTVQTRRSSTSSWITAWSNTAALTQGAYTSHTPTTGASGVVDVRLTMSSNRGDPLFMDMTELLVLGLRAP